jgi:hypothetical protein
VPRQNQLAQALLRLDGLRAAFELDVGAVRAVGVRGTKRGDGHAATWRKAVLNHRQALLCIQENQYSSHFAQNLSNYFNPVYQNAP